MKFGARPKPGDFFAAALILLLAWLIPALAVGAGSGEARTAVVTVDGAEVFRLSLSGMGDAFIPVSGAGGVELTVQIEAGRARFSSADCADHICVDTGWLRRQGQSAVCLPGRAVLRIEGYSSGGVDAVTG